MTVTMTGLASAWINFARMGEIGDSGPTRPKSSKLIHAAIHATGGAPKWR